MRRKKTLVLLAPVLVLSILLLVPAAIAIGPEQAAEVGNNPNLSSPGGNPVLDTPSGVHNLWTESYFNHWMSASKGEGKMNNAVIVGPPPTGDVKLVDLLTALSTDPSEYENTWIYFSKTMFRLFLINGQGMDPEEAGDTADLYPDGIYWHFVMVG